MSRQKVTPNNESDGPRTLRLRNQYFPGAEKVVIDVGRGGFVPMPIIIRKVMRHLSAPELRVLTYLQLRCDRYFICFPTLEEMAHELDLAGRRNLTPHLKALEQKEIHCDCSWFWKDFLSCS